MTRLILIVVKFLAYFAFHGSYEVISFRKGKKRTVFYGIDKLTANDFKIVMDTMAKKDNVKIAVVVLPIPSPMHHPCQHGMAR